MTGTQGSKQMSASAENDLLAQLQDCEGSRFLIHLRSGECMLGCIDKTYVSPARPPHANKIVFSKVDASRDAKGRPHVSVELSLSSIKRIERIDTDTFTPSPHSD